MTTYAFISDLHSNVEALTNVFDDIATLNVDKIWCLGDVVGYGPNPIECIDMVREIDGSLLGNHDEALLTGDMNEFNVRAQLAVEWTAKQLDESVDEDNAARWEWLRSLNGLEEVEGMTLVHGSPRFPTKEYIFPQHASNVEKMSGLFSNFPKICFGGHTHWPGVWTTRGEYLNPDDLCSIYIVGEEKVYVNVGSVGQPRNGQTSACYATFDGETVVFRRVPYDYKKTQEKIRAIDMLDNFLADRLALGR